MLGNREGIKEGYADASTETTVGEEMRAAAGDKGGAAFVGDVGTNMVGFNLGACVGDEIGNRFGVAVDWKALCGVVGARVSNAETGASIVGLGVAPVNPCDKSNSEIDADRFDFMVIIVRVIVCVPSHPKTTPWEIMMENDKEEEFPSNSITITHGAMV